jgi:hypothetical protein
MICHSAAIDWTEPGLAQPSPKTLTRSQPPSSTNKRLEIRRLTVKANDQQVDVRSVDTL